MAEGLVNHSWGPESLTPASPHPPRTTSRHNSCNLPSRGATAPSSRAQSARGSQIAGVMPGEPGRVTPPARRRRAAGPAAVPSGSGHILWHNSCGLLPGPPGDPAVPGLTEPRRAWCRSYAQRIPVHCCTPVWTIAPRQSPYRPASHHDVDRSLRPTGPDRGGPSHPAVLRGDRCWFDGCG